MSQVSVTGWRSVAAAGFLTVMGVLNVLDVAAYGFRFYALDLARTATVSAQLLEYSLVALGCISLIELVALVATAVVFIIWFHRLYLALGTLLHRERDHHTAWAIWGFIVPIISLFRPPEMAIEVAEKSRATTDEVRRPLIIFWWVLFLFGSLASNVAGILFSQHHPGAEQLGTVFGMVGSALLAVSAALGIKVVLYLERSLMGALTRARTVAVEPPNRAVAADASRAPC